ncbi:MAG: glycosyl hydrolase [Lacibacter sp.]
MKKSIILLGIVFTSVIADAQINWPAVSNVSKPWTRWWWEGSAVNKTDLTWNLQQYQKAGLGGVEITPIYGVEGYEKQFIHFLTPQWMQMLVHTLSESKRMGLGVDLANATGWPFGGPWVADTDASKSVYYKTYSLSGGEQLKDIIEYKREAWVRTANNKTAAIANIKNPVNTNTNLQELALDQVQFPGKLPLQTLIAYSSDTAIDVTKNVDADGKLNWTAPHGSWTLYALFEGLHGKMVERAAPGGEGYAIDHFSAKAANHYFAKFDEAFKGYDLSYLRGFFNDSYEVDDARGQANWTTDFFEQFQKRKGYDLRKHLPSLFGKADADANSRVIYDYRSVIDELILENFTQIWKKWGASRGKIVRNQSHGSPANTLDLYSVVDIPETEGTDILRFKFASSAANVAGKQLISSESATWLNDHFLSSLADVKKAIDLYFLGGVNHIFYHGTEYSPKEAKWPGWLFYAAVHFQPTNPQWKDFHVLNQYITRTQSFLQKGKPDNDVLLYYPVVDRYSEPGNVLLQHFDGMERNFEKTDFEHVSKWMSEEGYSFDFFSDRQLQKFTFSKNNIFSSGNQYRTILLPGNKLVDEKSFKKILALVKEGATVLVYKNMPGDVPGLQELEKRRESFQEMYKGIQFRNEGKVKRAVFGKGMFIVSSDLNVLMQSAKVRKEHLYEMKLSSLRRKNNDGTVYFITNRNENEISEWISLDENCASVALFDPMTGKKGLAKTRKNSNGQTEVLLQLQSFESVIVQLYKTVKKGTAFPYRKEAGSLQEINGEWTVSFLDGGPVIPAAIKTNQLTSWTEFAGDDVKNFSGTAKYTITFAKPTTASSYVLNLGKVNETAEVFLNGKRITTLIGPVYQCVIPASVFQPDNKLEVIVANLMANRISYMDRNNIPWKVFYNINMSARKKENVKNGVFDASAWKPLSSGLIGPVTIAPLK